MFSRFFSFFLFYILHIFNILKVKKKYVLFPFVFSSSLLISPLRHRHLQRACWLESLCLLWWTPFHIVFRTHSTLRCLIGIWSLLHHSARCCSVSRTLAVCPPASWPRAAWCTPSHRDWVSINPKVSPFSWVCVMLCVCVCVCVFICVSPLLYWLLEWMETSCLLFVQTSAFLLFFFFQYRDLSHSTDSQKGASGRRKNIISAN